MRWVWGISITLFVLVVFGAIAVWVFLRPIRQQFAELDRVTANMAKPEYYQPAGRVLARLARSDPSIFRSTDEFQLVWMPPELGKLQTHYINFRHDEAEAVVGGGMLEGPRYSLTRDDHKSTEKDSVWTLTLEGGANGQQTLDTFTLPNTDLFTEEQLVASALTELDREKAAFSTGSQLNLYGRDVDYLKAILLFHHPAIAQKLGENIPTAATTQHWYDKK